MAIKYLYLDDQPDSRTEAQKAEVEKRAPKPGLVIQLSSPKPFADQITQLSGASPDHFDGLILDLRLDQVAVKHSEKEKAARVAYRATSLAQEIRTRAAEGSRDYPLVLWSMDAKLQQSFTPDNTGHDLFDLKCVKESIEEPEIAQHIALQMVALVDGYQNIASKIKGKVPTLDLIRCLGVDDQPSLLDTRVLNSFEGRKKRLPAHEFANFIVRQLLDAPGPLIDEAWVFARLGIDSQQSGDLERLKQILHPVSYQGAFAQGWPRWWAMLLEKWWDEQPGSPGPLRRLKANERVAFLRKLTKLRHLSPAKPIETSYSTAYWTVCQVTGNPLDPRDGLALAEPHKMLWHERLYISTQAALQNEHVRRGWLLDTVERDRLQQLRRLSSQSGSDSDKAKGNEKSK